MSIDLWDHFSASADSEIDAFPAGIKNYLARQLSTAVVLPTLPDDTRKHNRIPMNQCALAVRLSESEQPNGQIFQIYVKDVSAGGLGFMHTRAFSGELLAIKLTGLSGDAIVMVGRVVRCICRQRAYEVGVQFTGRVTKSTTKEASQVSDSDSFAENSVDEPMPSSADPIEAVENSDRIDNTAPESIVAVS